MIKPPDLIDWLKQTVPDLAKDPERLFVFTENGQAVPRGGGPTFEYRYTLKVILLDLPVAQLDAVVVALIFWLSRHQPEALQSPQLAEDVLSYQLEMLDRLTADFSCDLKLTESVSVVPRSDGAGFDVIHRPEPVIDPPFSGVPADATLRRLITNGELVAQSDLP